MPMLLFSRAARFVLSACLLFVVAGLCMAKDSVEGRAGKEKEG